MREFRLGKNDKEYYTSFEDLAKAWGCKPVSRQTSDLKKLEEQRNKFLSRHKCRACGNPMSFIGGNQMCCLNSECRGIKRESVNEETGEKRVWYIPSFHLLDEKGSEIASNIFA